MLCGALREKQVLDSKKVSLLFNGSSETHTKTHIRYVLYEVEIDTKQSSGLYGRVVVRNGSGLTVDLTTYHHFFLVEDISVSDCCMMLIFSLTVSLWLIMRPQCKITGVPPSVKQNKQSLKCVKWS